MRLQIAKRTELMVRVLQTLDDGRRHKSAAIADAVESSPAFVTQLLRPPVAAGWVTSIPGPAGGYELRQSLDEVSLLDVIEASEGPTDDGRCVLEARQCHSECPCALHEPWVRARQLLVESLGAVAVSSLPITSHATSVSTSSSTTNPKEH